MRLKIMLIMCAAILLCGSCTNNAAETPLDPPLEAETPAVPNDAQEELPDVSGLTLLEAEFPRLDGSTATIPLGEALAALMLGKERDECKQYAEFSGTNEAYKRLVDNKADLLLVYEMPDDAADYQSFVKLDIAPIGRDALVFMVNSQNPIDNLTRQQVVDIYAGNITNWQEVGGADTEIAAFQRNQTSGSQTLMNKLVMKDTPLMAARENYIASGMSEIITAIATYDNASSAIGYNVHYYVTEMKKDPNIKLLSIDGVYPDNSTISSGEYPFVNDFYAVVRESSPPHSPERKLFYWLQSAEGQMLVDSQGYAALSKQTH